MVTFRYMNTNVVQEHVNTHCSWSCTWTCVCTNKYMNVYLCKGLWTIEHVVHIQSKRTFWYWYVLVTHIEESSKQKARQRSSWRATFGQFLAGLDVLYLLIWKKGMNSTVSFKSTQTKQLTRQGIEPILPLKQTRRSLPCLLLPSFFYGYTAWHNKIKCQKPLVWLFL